jgi:hypothetical protein
VCWGSGVAGEGQRNGRHAGYYTGCACLQFASVSPTCPLSSSSMRFSASKEAPHLTAIHAKVVEMLPCQDHSTALRFDCLRRGHNNHTRPQTHTTVVQVLPTLKQLHYLVTAVVIPQCAHKCCLDPQLGQRSGHVAGGASWVGCPGLDFVPWDALVICKEVCRKGQVGRHAGAAVRALGVAVSWRNGFGSIKVVQVAKPSGCKLL